MGRCAAWIGLVPFSIPLDHRQEHLGTPCRLSVWRAKAKMNGSSPGAAMSDLAILGTYSVFLASYIVFALGKFPGMKIDRPGAAIIGAVLMVAFRIMSTQEALRAIDFATIVLLFSMMLIVANLHLGRLPRVGH